MDEFGRMEDVIIEDNMGEDPRTGMAKFFGFIVWAEAGLESVIDAIRGITSVRAYKTEYFVSLDPRYSREFIRREIEAQVKIHMRAEETIGSQRGPTEEGRTK